MELKVTADGFVTTLTNVKSFSTEGGALVVVFKDNSIRAWGPGFWVSFIKEAK